MTLRFPVCIPCKKLVGNFSKSALIADHFHSHILHQQFVKTTDPENVFAYEAHTACDKNGFVLGVEVTAGNVHDSVAWDNVYDEVTAKHKVKFVTMDAGYKTPWIVKKTFDDGRTPILPYTRPTRKRTGYKPWDYSYDPVKDQFICPQGQILRHTTTDKDGKRT